MVKISRAKPTVFKFYAPHARKVYLAGTFNNWDIASLGAKKDSKGTWSIKLNLKPGRYEYKFVVDGSWINDPGCTACVGNSYGSSNCVVEIA